MAVKLREMTEEEFQRFYRWSLENQTRELMAQLHLSREAAEQSAEKELAEMLPEGLCTEHNHLLTILEEEESVGFVWLLYEEFEGRKQSFICDFALWEAKRGKGYGVAAMQLAEELAAKDGCQESVLFVTDDNLAARALYSKCGYRVLRQKDYGKFMVKPLG